MALGQDRREVFAFPEIPPDEPAETGYNPGHALICIYGNRPRF